jgi:hydantoinase/carbamoylase family amidase
VTEAIAIDRARSAARIERHVETLAEPAYSRSQEAIQRWSFTPEYRATLDYFARELAALGFDVSEDAVGNFVARNRPPGTPVFGLGSHCDSNRNGGKWDGTLGVVLALEVATLSHELGLDLPLQVISFMEEESSGFNVPLLGSRIMAGWVTDDELDAARAIDGGRPFMELAREAGYEPTRWRESVGALADLIGWIEPHIEQGPYLWDSGDRIGLVEAIIGFAFGDVTVHGRASHAGGTPMDSRKDALVVAAESVVELERMAGGAGQGTVGTVGELHVRPGLVNAVPGEVQFSLDIRSTDPDAFLGVSRDILAFAEQAAGRRGMTVDYVERVVPVPPAIMDGRILDALEGALKATGEPYRRMPSRGGHDTSCVAAHKPAAMVFVPCRDGISHSPEELARPEDAALAAEVILSAVRGLV